jgi:hypothetical protein
MVLGNGDKIQKLEDGNLGLNALVRELSAQIETVNNRDLRRTQGMLIARPTH